METSVMTPLFCCRRMCWLRFWLVVLIDHAGADVCRKAGPNEAIIRLWLPVGRA